MLNGAAHVTMPAALKSGCFNSGLSFNSDNRNHVGLGFNSGLSFIVNVEVVCGVNFF